MTSIIFWLLVALAAGFATWRVASARSRKTATPPTPQARENEHQKALLAARKVALEAGQMPSATEPASAAPAAKAVVTDIEAARATARAEAERVIAAEAARRKAAIQKAQNVARVEAERRAAKAAEAAAALATTIPLDPLRVAKANAPAAPVVAPPTPAAPPAVVRAVEKTAPLLRPVPPRAAAAPTVLKSAAQTLILLVDDSKMVRVKSSRLLAAHGFQVALAVDGVDALKQLETSCPDLVITDVDMPEMDGFGLTNALRGNPRTQHIPIVMITSAEDRHREEALRVGVGLVLGKPYDEAALVEHIRSFKFFAKAEEAQTLACA
ncbi:MAG: response regulator [Betaproteobacteria bacterium]